MIDEINDTNYNKLFHIGDILSITTDKMLSPRHMLGVYDILSYMTGVSIYTLQIVRAINVCGPALLKIYPKLEGLSVPDVSGMSSSDKKRILMDWVDEQGRQFGEMLLVPKLDSYPLISPLEELYLMRGSIN